MRIRIQAMNNEHFFKVYIFFEHIKLFHFFYCKNIMNYLEK